MGEVPAQGKLTPPPEVDRKTFVRVAAGAAVAGGLLSLPALLPPTLQIGRRSTYLGARRLSGPGPKGLPLIPIQVRPDGTLEGIPKGGVPGYVHSTRWYAYCQHGAAPGVSPDYAGDNVLRYFQNPAKVASAERELGEPLWYAERLDQPMRASDFAQVGMGAPFRWRSEGQEQTNVLTGVVIKVDPGTVKGLVAESTISRGFVAFASSCTRDCCVAGWKESKIARDQGRFDKMFCTCSDTAYDPLDLRTYTLPADDDVLATTTFNVTA